MTWPAHKSVDITRMLLEDWTTRYEDKSYFQWAIVLKESESVIGSIAVVDFKEDRCSTDIGYCLGRRYWGHGIMPEALAAVMNYLFYTVGVNRIAACHDANNPKSGRVMQKAGMKFEGILRGAGKNNQGICDEVWYAALRSDRDHAQTPSPSSPSDERA